MPNHAQRRARPPAARRRARAITDALEPRRLLAGAHHWPLGPETQVNASTSASHRAPAVAMDPAGNAVVAWERQSAGSAIFARRYGAAGEPAGAEFRVDPAASGPVGGAAVAMDDDGDFVVTWTGPGAGDILGVYAQRYNAAGLAQGPVFRANTFTTGGQSNPSVASDSSGNFVIAWDSEGQDGSTSGVYAQRFSATGVMQGGEFRVNDFTTSVQGFSSTTMSADGAFTIAWYGSGIEDGIGIFVRRYDALGAPLGSEQGVNAYTTGSQFSPSAATDGAGNVVVAWSGVGNEGIGIYARRFDATGMPYADDFLVANRTTTSVVVSVGCAADDNGDFVITWESPGEDGSRDDVFARRYDVSGSAQGGAFRVNTSTGGDQRAPAVAVDADGDFLVTWQSSHLDQLIGYEIYAQRYTTFESVAGGTVGDRVWDDGNADGLQDDGEPGIPGALVELYTDAGSPVASTTTGAEGNYVFPIRDGERARLRFLAPNGFIPVRVRQGIDPQRDSDADRVTGQTILLAPASAGSAVSDVDAGFSVPAAVSGAVFFDRNDNGVRDGGEEGVGGFLVFQDLDADGARDADEPARVTDPSGNYAMTDALGGTYRIVAQDQHLWVEPSLPPLNVAPGGAASASNLPVRTSARDTAATPAGNEFRANAYTTNHQSEPAVAMDGSGDFVVAWESYTQDGSGSGIYAQRYDDSGAPRGAEFRVNSHTSGSQRYPAVAADAAGNVVVAWYGPGPGDGSGIFARRFDADGAALGTEFRVNTNTADEQFFPSVAMTASGAVLVTWVSRTGDGSGEGIYAQRYDGSGAPQGSEFRVNTQTIGAQRFPEAAIDAAGNFVITWESRIGDGSDYGIFARLFDAGGVPRGDEFLVNSYTTGEQLRPTIATDAQGNFVIAWESRDQDGYTMGVYAQRYGADGAPRGPEFRVNAYTLFSQASASAAMTPAGEFVIAWVDGSRDGGNGPGVYAQRFNAAGLRQGEEFRVNTYTTNSQYAADAAVDTDGDFVVTWTSRGQDAPGTYGAYAQRYAAAVRPAVTAGRFHWQTAPQGVELAFDQDVSASISPDDLIVRNLTTAQTVPSDLIVVSWDAAAMTARFAFPSLPDGGALPNGDYVATLVAGGVSNAAGTSIAVDYAVPFFFLRGDANRDGRVNLTDFNILAANFGASPRDFSQGDFNYDGLVNLTDFNLLAAHFGGGAAAVAGVPLARHRLAARLIDQLEL